MESYFAMEAFADDNPHRVRRPMSDLALVEATMDEIEARSAGRAAKGKQVAAPETLSALAFAAQAGDTEARGKLRQRAALD